jgi:hypothetical protein
VREASPGSPAASSIVRTRIGAVIGFSGGRRQGSRHPVTITGDHEKRRRRYLHRIMLDEFANIYSGKRMSGLGNEAHLAVAMRDGQLTNFICGAECPYQ